MSDRDRPEWISDPAVSGWLGTPGPTPPPSSGEGSEVAATDQDSPSDQSPHDDSVWAQDPAVAHWLSSPSDREDYPEPRGTTAQAPGIYPAPTGASAPPVMGGTGYDADATIQMAPITDSAVPPTRSEVPDQPFDPASAPVGMVAAPAASGPRRRLRRPQRRTAIMAAAVAAAAALVLGLVITTLATIGGTSDDGDGPVAQPPPPPAHSQPATTAAKDADCPNRTDGAVTTGRDAGDTFSGPGVIKAFEHAYYVARDGAKARALGIELARMGSAEAMQTFIDTQLAPGTLHCVRITERGPQLWALELTEIAPGGGETQAIHQLVQTATINGRVLIAAITKDIAP